MNDGGGLRAYNFFSQARTLKFSPAKYVDCGALTRVLVESSPRGIINDLPPKPRAPIIHDGHDGPRFLVTGNPPLIFIRALNLVNSRARLHRRSDGAAAASGRWKGDVNYIYVFCVLTRDDVPGATLPRSISRLRNKTRRYTGELLNRSTGHETSVVSKPVTSVVSFLRS